MRLDQETLLELCRLSDPVGILSVCVGTTPERQTHAQPEWAITLRNALKDLRQRVRDEGPRSRWTALDGALDGLRPALDDLVDPKAPGRGRALYACASSGETRRVALQMPLPDVVEFGPTAYVRPLVAALDEGRAAGVAVIDRSGLRVFEWRFGEAVELFARDFTEPEGMRELKGPAAGNPAMSQHQAPQHDLYEERIDNHRVRFLREEAGRLGSVVDAQRWDRIVVAGDARFAQPFAEGLPRRRSLGVFRFDHDLRHASPSEIGQTVQPVLDRAQRDREMALVREVTERALGRGQGALGLTDTLGALVEGRVRHLLYDDGRELSGYRDKDGRLLSDGDNEGPTRSELTPEPLLVERMIERAFETGAAVTPVDEAAAEALESYDGVAAFLRW